MNIYRVALFGHRYLSSITELEGKLYDAVEKLIRANEFVEFYIGRNGEFDEVAASVIKRVQKKSGGAFRAIKYAEERGVPVLNLGDDLPDIT